MNKVRLLLKGSNQTQIFNNVTSVRMQEGLIIIKHGSLTASYDTNDIETMLVEEA